MYDVLLSHMVIAVKKYIPPHKWEFSHSIIKVLTIKLGRVLNRLFLKIKPCSLPPRHPRLSPLEDKEKGPFFLSFLLSHGSDVSTSFPTSLDSIEMD